MEYNFINWFTPGELFVYGKIMTKDELSARLFNTWRARNKNSFSGEMNHIKDSYDCIASDVFEVAGEFFSGSIVVSRDNEIKMQMASDFFSAFIQEMPENLSKEQLSKVVSECCDVSEQIFNRFNK